MTTVSFDQAVKYYDNTRGYPPGVPEQIRNAIVQYTRAHPSTRFLELGIGTGLIGIPFLESSYDYVGVDISAQMLAQIHLKLDRSIKQNHPQLIQADITQHLPFADNSFDVVTAIRVFHVLDNWQSAIAEAKRVLHQYGYLVIARDTSIDTPGMTDPVTSIHSKWDEILESLGIASGMIRPGLWLSDEIIKLRLQAEGATTQIVDLLTYNSMPLSIRMIAKRHQQRMYSRDWELSDTVHAEAVNILNAWLDNECTKSDTEVIRKMIFQAIIARWDK